MKPISFPSAPSVQLAINEALRHAEREISVPNDDGRFSHDRILSLNDSLITQANYSVPLTTYAVGYRDKAPLRELLNFLAPEVPVTRRFTYKEFTSWEAFLSDEGDDDTREPRGDFKTVREATSTERSEYTRNRGLKIQVDEDQVVEQLNGADWKQFYTQRLMDRLARNKFRRALALAVAAATATSKTWASGTPNADMDVRNELRAAADASGVRPNRVLYGETAWDYRLAGYEAQLTAASVQAVNRDEARLATYLNVDQVMVSGSRYTSSASAKTQVVGAKMLAFTAQDSITKEDPSNLKTFISPVEGGGYVRVFERQVGTKLWEIAVEEYNITKLTASSGIRLLNIS